jgi:hypothetical protein
MLAADRCISCRIGGTPMCMHRITNNITTSIKAVAILKIDAIMTADTIMITTMIITNFKTLRSTRFGGFFIAYDAEEHAIVIN